MKPEQQKEFIELFKELLQGVYADRLLTYTDEKIVFDKELDLKKGRAEVQSNIVLSDGTKVPISTGSPTRAASGRPMTSSLKASAW